MYFRHSQTGVILRCKPESAYEHSLRCLRRRLRFNLCFNRFNPVEMWTFTLDTAHFEAFGRKVNMSQAISKFLKVHYGHETRPPLYFWRLEVGEHGTHRIHVHMLTEDRAGGENLPLPDARGYKQGHSGSYNTALTAEWGQGYVNVRTVDDRDVALFYVMKYCSKSPDAPNPPDAKTYGRRRWGCSREIIPPPKSLWTLMEDDPAVCEKKMAAAAAVTEQRGAGAEPPFSVKTRLHPPQRNRDGTVNIQEGTHHEFSTPAQRILHDSDMIVPSQTVAYYQKRLPVKSCASSDEVDIAQFMRPVEGGYQFDYYRFIVHVSQRFMDPLYWFHCGTSEYQTWLHDKAEKHAEAQRSAAFKRFIRRCVKNGIKFEGTYHARAAAAQAQFNQEYSSTTTDSTLLNFLTL